MKRIAIIGTAGIPARYGGFETLAQNLVRILYSEFRFIVYCNRKLYNKQERSKYCNYAELVYLPVNSNGPQSIIYDIIAMIHAVKNADILLILGISACLFLPFVKLFSNKNIITHVDGLEWKRNKWNPLVKLFLKLSELFAIKYSDKIIADNEAIKAYIENKFNIIPKLIEYGGDHSVILPDNEKIDTCFKDLKNPYALTISRIEAENNIHVILYAFSNFPSKNIVIVGNWGNNKYSRKLCKKYRSYSNISLYDSIYDQSTLNLLRSHCEMYIHGHSAGGTNPSLVEAMYAGKPVIAYDVIYNRITTMNEALYFKSSKDLVNMLKKTRKSVLDQNKLNMKEIARNRYRWKLISEKYASLFNIW